MKHVDDKYLMRKLLCHNFLSYRVFLRFFFMILYLFQTTFRFEWLKARFEEEAEALGKITKYNIAR